MATRGRLRRGLRLWMNSANSSLPVPVSPDSSTVVSSSATAAAWSMTAVIAGLDAEDAPALGIIQLGAQFGDRRLQRLLLQCFPHEAEEQREIDRLGEIIEGSVPHGRDGLVRVAVGRDENDGEPRRRGPDAPEQIEAALGPQLDIRDDEADGVAMRREGRDGLIQRGSRDDFRAALGDERGRDLQRVGVVFDDEDLGAGRGWHGG